MKKKLKLHEEYQLGLEEGTTETLGILQRDVFAYERSSNSRQIFFLRIDFYSFSPVLT